MPLAHLLIVLYVAGATMIASAGADAERAETGQRIVGFVVWDAAAEKPITITRNAMVASLTAFAKTFRPGSPARAEWERKALDVARGGTAGFMTSADAPEQPRRHQAVTAGGGHA